MRKRKIYIKKKLNYRIKVICFIIFTVLILNCVNNIFKSFHISTNESLINENEQVIDNQKKENQEENTLLNENNSYQIPNDRQDIDNNTTDYTTNNETINNFERDINKFKNKKLIAFTFDDGPNSKTTNKLLDNLNKYNARVTFFVVGNRVKTYEDILKRAYDMGNLIGSHTYNHKNLFELNNNQIVDEIKKTNNVIKEVTGSNTLYLRPPYGNTNKNIKNLANMYNILWDLDTEDWKYKDKNRIAKYIIDNAHDGGIILLHDLYETSIDGALLAMEELSKNGYAFVTIEEMATLKGITLNKASNYFNLK